MVQSLQIHIPPSATILAPLESFRHPLHSMKNKRKPPQTPTSASSRSFSRSQATPRNIYSSPHERAISCSADGLIEKTRVLSMRSDVGGWRLRERDRRGDVYQRIGLVSSALRLQPQPSVRYVDPAIRRSEASRVTLTL